MKKRKLSKTEQAELKMDLVNKKKSLANHANSANINHDRVVEHLKEALRHARIAGNALNRAKRIVKSQKELWKPWLEKNFSASYETAASYMRIAREWKLIEGVVQEGVNMTLREALHFLRLPKKKQNIKRFDAKYSRRMLLKKFEEWIFHLPNEEAIFLFECDNGLFRATLEGMKEEIELLTPTIVEIAKERFFEEQEYDPLKETDEEDEERIEKNELNRKKSVFKKFKTRPWYLKPLTPYQNDVIRNELSGYWFYIQKMER